MVQVWVLLCKEGCVLFFSLKKGSSLWLIGMVFKKNVDIYTFLEALGSTLISLNEVICVLRGTILLLWESQWGARSDFTGC